MDEKAVFIGSLCFISLSDIFQILGGNGSTGTLHFTSQYTPNPAVIYFVNGNPINAGNGPLKALDAIYAIFGWTDGRFEFHEEDVKVPQEIKNSRMEIVLDALRMVDDGVIKKVGPPSFDEVDAVKTGAAKGKDTLQVIKGALVDYDHVVGEEEFRDGDRVAREGGYGKWIRVIMKGTADVSKETPNGPMTIARLGEGCFIGTLNALSYGGSVRSATVTAVGDVELALLDTERLSREHSSLSPEFNGLLLSLEERLIKITNRVVELSLKEDKSKGLLKDKKVIMQKGSSKKELFTISEGEAYVVGQTRKGSLHLLTLQKEDVFGYMPFLDMGHEPRLTGILASEDLQVNKLDTKSLQNEYNKLSGTFRNMIYHTATCIFTTTKLAYRLHEKK